MRSERRGGEENEVLTFDFEDELEIGWKPLPFPQTCP
jgi:hypothetical protein